MDVSISLHEAMILTKFHIILFSLFFFICALGGSSAADSLPLMPAEFYGTVYIENTPAPIGTTVTVLLNGILIDELITIEPGVFGGTGIFDKRLSVVVDGANTDSSIIQFQVNGISTPGKEEFAPGRSKKVELFVTSAGFEEGMSTPAVTALPTQIFTPMQTQIEEQIILIGDPFDQYDSFIPYDPYYPEYPQPYNEFQGERIFFSNDGDAQLISHPGSEMRTAAGGIVQQVTFEHRSLAGIQTPQGLLYAGYGYELAPANLLFLPDATFIIYIDDDIFDEHPMIMRYDVATGAWANMPSLADRFAGTVRASITESGVYGVVIQDMTPVVVVTETPVPVPEAPISTAQIQTPPITGAATPMQTETIAPPRAPVPPPQSKAIWYIAGGILLIIIINIIIWRVYGHARKEEKQEEEL
jgi:hypothetical protein